ncbi:MAG: NAD kinase [Cyclobacteriaceae bacterium]|nr:NAD kinase [Cyclobacteriaceae bacterium]
MRIGIHGKEVKGQQVKFIENFLDMLVSNKVDISVSSKFLKYLKSPRISKFKIKSFDLGDNLNRLDAFISLGGDGTLLDSVTYLGKNETPIMGINTGRMGFLSTISRDETEKAIEHLLKSTFQTDSRTVLSLESDKKLFNGLNFALNDFTIIKKDTSSMINIHVFVDNELLNSYWADGIIVSTPTGSTGYSLSCGGPLLYPRSESFVITPVSPHNLTARPIVISDNSEISFHIEGRSKKFLISLDSRVEAIDGSVNLKVKKAKFKVQLVQMPGQHYFKTLRQKLHWGLDIRN